MRNRVAYLCLLLFLASPFTGQTDGWKQYQNATGNFRVLFPGEPQDSVNKSDAEIESHTLMAQQKPAYYTVVYTNMASPQSADDANYQIFKNAVFKELPKCQVAQEGQVSPTLDGYIGHSYRLSCAMPNVQLTMVGNLYWGQHHAYAVMAMFPDNGGEPPEVRTFVESFSVIDPAK